MTDDRAQISMEYLLIFAVSLIILMVFTLPLAEESIKNTIDVSDSLSAKYAVSKIAQAIREVYGEGQGSKRTIDLDLERKITISVSNTHISCSLKLKGGSNKQIRESFKSTLKKNSITLNKGRNVVTVEWPIGSGNMIIYTQ